MSWSTNPPSFLPEVPAPAGLPLPGTTRTMGVSNNIDAFGRAISAGFGDYLENVYPTNDPSGRSNGILGSVMGGLVRPNFIANRQSDNDQNAKRIIFHARYLAEDGAYEQYDPTWVRSLTAPGVPGNFYERIKMIEVNQRNLFGPEIKQVTTDNTPRELFNLAQLNEELAFMQLQMLSREAPGEIRAHVRDPNRKKDSRWVLKSARNIWEKSGFQWNGVLNSMNDTARGSSFTADRQLAGFTWLHDYFGTMWLENSGGFFIICPIHHYWAYKSTNSLPVYPVCAPGGDSGKAPMAMSSTWTAAGSTGARFGDQGGRSQRSFEDAAGRRFYGPSSGRRGMGGSDFADTLSGRIAAARAMSSPDDRIDEDDVTMDRMLIDAAIQEADKRDADKAKEEAMRGPILNVKEFQDRVNQAVAINAENESEGGSAILLQQPIRAQSDSYGRALPPRAGMGPEPYSQRFQPAAPVGHVGFDLSKFSDSRKIRQAYGESFVLYQMVGYCDKSAFDGLTEKEIEWFAGVSYEEGPNRCNDIGYIRIGYARHGRREDAMKTRVAGELSLSGPPPNVPIVPSDADLTPLVRCAIARDKRRQQAGNINQSEFDLAPNATMTFFPLLDDTIVEYEPESDDTAGAMDV